MFGLNILNFKTKHTDQTTEEQSRTYTRYARSSKQSATTSGKLATITQKMAQQNAPPAIEDRISFPVLTLCQPRTTLAGWIKQNGADRHTANLAALIVSELLHPSRPHALTIAEHLKACTSLAETAISQANPICPEFTAEFAKVYQTSASLSKTSTETPSTSETSLSSTTSDAITAPLTLPAPDAVIDTPAEHMDTLLSLLIPPPFLSPSLPMPPDAPQITPSPAIPALLTSLVPLTHRLAQMLYAVESLLSEPSSPSALVQSGNATKSEKSGNSQKQHGNQGNTQACPVLSLPTLRIDGISAKSYSSEQDVPFVDLPYELCEHLRHISLNMVSENPNIANPFRPILHNLAPRGGTGLAMPALFTALPAELPILRSTTTSYARSITKDAELMKDIRKATHQQSMNDSSSGATVVLLEDAAKNEALPPSHMNPYVFASRVGHKVNDKDSISGMVLSATLAPVLAKLPLERRVAVLGAIIGLSSSPIVSDRVLRSSPHILSAAQRIAAVPLSTESPRSSDPSTLAIARNLFATCVPPQSCVSGDTHHTHRINTLTSRFTGATSSSNLPKRRVLRGEDVHALLIARSSLHLQNQLAVLTYADPSLAKAAPSLLRAVSATGIYNAVQISRRYLQCTSSDLDNYAAVTGGKSSENEDQNDELPPVPESSSRDTEVMTSDAVVPSATPALSVDISWLHETEATLAVTAPPPSSSEDEVVESMLDDEVIDDDIEDIVPAVLEAESLSDEEISEETPPGTMSSLPVYMISDGKGEKRILRGPICSILTHTMGVLNQILPKEMSVWKSLPLKAYPVAVPLCPATIYCISRDTICVSGHFNSISLPTPTGLMSSLALIHPMRPYDLLTDMQRVLHTKFITLLGTSPDVDLDALQNYYYSLVLPYFTHVYLTQRAPALLCVLRAISNVTRINMQTSLQQLSETQANFDKLARKGHLPSRLLSMRLTDGSALYEGIRRITSGELALLRGRRMPLYGRAREILSTHKMDLLGDPLLASLFFQNGFAAFTENRLQVTNYCEATRVYNFQDTRLGPRPVFKDAILRSNAPMFISPPRAMEEAVPISVDTTPSLPIYKLPENSQIFIVNNAETAKQAFQIIKSQLPPVPDVAPTHMLAGLLARDAPSIHDHASDVQRQLKQILLENGVPFQVEQHLPDPSGHLTALLQASDLPGSLEELNTLCGDSNRRGDVIVSDFVEENYPVTGIPGGSSGLDHVFPLVVGLDTESTPSLKQGQPVGPLQLFQVAIGDFVMLFDLQKWCFEMDMLLYTVLAHPSVLKVGVGVIDDLIDLRDRFPDSLALKHVRSHVCLAETSRLVTLFSQHHSNQQVGIKDSTIISSLYTPLPLTSPHGNTSNTLYHTPSSKVVSERDARTAELVARTLVELSPEVSGVNIPSRFEVPLGLSKMDVADILRQVLMPQAAQVKSAGENVMDDAIHQRLMMGFRGTTYEKTSASSTAATKPPPPASPAVSAPSILSALCYVQSRLPTGFSMGLRPLAVRFTRCDLDKSEQVSAWQQRPLTDSQLRYAATDAHVAPAIFRGQQRRMPYDAMLASLRVLVRAASRRMRK